MKSIDQRRRELERQYETSREGNFGYVFEDLRLIASERPEVEFLLIVISFVDRITAATKRATSPKQRRYVYKISGLYKDKEMIFLITIGAGKTSSHLELKTPSSRVRFKTMCSWHKDFKRNFIRLMDAEGPKNLIQKVSNKIYNFHDRASVENKRYYFNNPDKILEIMSNLIEKVE